MVISHVEFVGGGQKVVREEFGVGLSAKREVLMLNEMLTPFQIIFLQIRKIGYVGLFQNVIWVKLTNFVRN